MDTQNQTVMGMIRDVGACRTGHFLLRNGKHTDTILECSHLTENTETAERLCDMLQARCADCDADLILGTASGGLVFGYGLARRLGLPFMYAERREDGYQLRRGFRIPEHARVLIVEDIVSTGNTVRQMLGIIRNFGAEPVAVATIVDRTRGRVRLSIPMISLAEIEANTYVHTVCPMCKAGIPVSPYGMEVRERIRREQHE